MSVRLRAVLFFAIVSVSLTGANGSETDMTELLVVSSLHSAHKGHSTFGYDDLFLLVQTFDPDFVGVEIRPEDIGMDRGYLSSNYPREMVELAQQYQERAFGFDWLGDEIAGKPIPESYFRDLRVKKLSEDLAKDEAMMEKKPAQISRLEEEQGEIVAAATAASLADGRYGALCRQIDELEQRWLAGSQYEEIIDFSRRRDEEIARNLIRFVGDHPGSRIVAVMGADHRTFAAEAVRGHYAEAVRIIEVSEIHE